jgi:hypothetical protein
VNKPWDLDAKDVARYAQGQWDRIYASLAPGLSDALSKFGHHVACPIHGGTNGFRLDQKSVDGAGICNTCDAFVKGGKRGFLNGFSILMWVNNDPFPKVLEDVASIVAPHLLDKSVRRRANPPPRPVYTPPPRTQKDIDDDHRKVERMRKAWRGSFAMTDPRAKLAWRYLESRGLPSVQELGDIWESIRFVPSLYYRDEESGEKGYFPAIIALLHTKEGHVSAMHRIYLASDGYGKAPVRMPKKLMSKPDCVSLSTGAIRLGPPGKVIAVTEGFETALAVRAFTGFAVWSTYSATLLRQFEPPVGTHGVHIFGDKDRPERGEEGQKSTDALRESLLGLGYSVRADIPPGEIPVGQKSLDWLDIYNQFGQRAITKVASLESALARRTVTPFPVGARRAG